MPDFPELSKKYGIIGVPTFTYFKDGILLGQDVGVQNIDDFKPELRLNIKQKFDASYTPQKMISQRDNKFFTLLQNWYQSIKNTIQGWFIS